MLGWGVRAEVGVRHLEKAVMEQLPEGVRVLLEGKEKEPDRRRAWVGARGDVTSSKSGEEKVRSQKKEKALNMVKALELTTNVQEIQVTEKYIK